MNFEQTIPQAEKIGRIAGFMFSYALFATIISFIFSLRLSVTFLVPLAVIFASLIFKKLFS